MLTTVIDREPARSRLADAIAVILVLAAVTRIFLEYSGCGLVGWDTYPMIEVSRIRSPGDLFEIFSTSLLGKEVGGLYYRPVPKLSLAIDYALWRLWAPGYQLSSALLFGVAAWGIHRLARSLIGGKSAVGPLAALVFFLIHPVHAAVIPVPSRRADVLCVLFMSFALAEQARASCASRSRVLISVVLATLALASKETAFLLPPLVALVAFLYSRETAPRRRAIHALKATAPVLAVTLSLVFVRLAVLGGIVGERPLQETALPSAALAMLGRIASAIISPGFIIGEADPPFLGLGLLAATLVAAGLLARRDARSDAATVSIRPIVLSMAWIAGVALLYSVGMIFQPWYLLNAIAGSAVLVGASSQLLMCLGHTDRPARGAAAAGLFCIAFLMASLAAYSPLVRSYDQWRSASEITERYLNELQGKIERAPTGTVVRMKRAPRRAGGGGRGLVGVAGMADYSVDAWAQLSFPERRIQVLPFTSERPVEEDEVLVLLGQPRRGRAGPQGM
jgi:hypothetical protein